jgi:RNA polymerase sigma factor (sigma-70 family)
MRSDDQIEKLTRAVVENERSFAAFAWRIFVGRGISSREDVRDALSEAYLLAATKLRHNPTLVVENHAAWFQRILFFVCLATAKKRFKTEAKGIDVEALHSEADTLEMVYNQLFQPDRRIDMEEILSALSDTDRKILQMSLEGYTSEEIAESLNTTAPNIRQRKSRALQELRKRLST